MTETVELRRPLRRGRRGSGRARSIGRRLVTLPFLLLGMTLLMFLISRFLPADPAVAFLGNNGADNQQAVDAFNAKYGLDKPLYEQYWIYLDRLLHGDLGTSISTGRPVSSELASAFPATIELAGAALLLSLLLGIPFGILAAARRRSVLDRLTGGVSMLGVSMPPFVLALVALQVLYLQLGWVAGPGRLDPFLDPPPTVTGLMTIDALLAGQPAVAGDVLHHLLLPALVLGLIHGAYFARVVRSTMIDTLGSDFVRTARGKGLAGPVIVVGHAFRVALVPTLSLIGLTFGELFAGAITVETITGWPGVGRYMYNAATKLDFPAVMAGTLVIGAAYVVVNLVVDILYGVADPRVEA
ncbi:ABC transporter permease [Asanoa sp. NPDC049573]|uniref:ABC transporter permease n=1 Tax=Asanoa sp. NPDC049573 TaxID=3155396 RepID=UPI00343E6F5A